MNPAPPVTSTRLPTRCRLRGRAAEPAGAPPLHAALAGQIARVGGNVFVADEHSDQVTVLRKAHVVRRITPSRSGR